MFKTGGSTYDAYAYNLQQLLGGINWKIFPLSFQI